MAIRPGLKDEAHEFRPVVDAKPLRVPVDLDQLIERAHHADRRERGVDLNTKRFAVEVIDDVKRAKAPYRSQGVTHEVGRPGVVTREWHGEWLTNAFRQPLLPASWPVEVKLAVDAPQAGFAAGRRATSQGAVQEPKAVPGVLGNVGCDRLDDGRVVLGSRAVIRHRAREGHDAAGAARRESVMDLNRQAEVHAFYPAPNFFATTSFKA